MKPHLRFLRSLLRHKWYVFVAGLRYRAPLLALLVHDWSKFTPAEWGAYVRNFYGLGRTAYTARAFKRWVQLAYGGDTAVRLARRDWQIEERERRDAFDVAWLHHQKRNRHHWQYWLLVPDQPPKTTTATCFQLDEYGIRDPAAMRELDVLVRDANRYRALPMPERYIREMVADWAGAGRAYTGKWEVATWYEKNRDSMVLHPATRLRVEQLLGLTRA